MALTPQQQRQFEQDGFVIFRRAFSQQTVRELREAVQRLVDRGRRGEVELKWVDQDKGIVNRVAHMLEPKKYDDVFGRWHDECLIDLVEPIIGGPCRHSLFGMLASGGGKPYVLPWHRDLTAPDDATAPAIYAPRLPQPFAQFNAPLTENDRYLQVIPGSHGRPSTPQEKAAFHNGNRGGDMPGMVTVELQPGDIVIYNALIWHRGYNPEGNLRWSMHAAYWQADAPVMAHEAGQCEALGEPDHLKRLPPRVRQLVQRYIDQHPEPGEKAPTLYEVFVDRSESAPAT